MLSLSLLSVILYLYVCVSIANKLIQQLVCVCLLDAPSGHFACAFEIEQLLNENGTELRKKQQRVFLIRVFVSRSVLPGFGLLLNTRVKHREERAEVDLLFIYFRDSAALDVKHRILRLSASPSPVYQ